MAAVQLCTTIVGVFEDSREADQAIRDLIKEGFRQDQSGVAMRHDDGTTVQSSATTPAESHTGSGAVTGALTGLGLGALAGLGVLSGVIPVVGPAIAAGTLGVIVSNAAAGAGIVGLVGALVGAGVPEHEAKFYDKEFEAGRTVVTVTADHRADEATAILRRHGAYDMSTRNSVLPRTAGATTQAVAPPASQTAVTATRATTVHSTGRGADPM